MRDLGLQLATAGVSALLLVSPVSAQSGSTDQARQDKNRQMEQSARAEFKQLDENNDQKLEWDEIEPRLENADAKDKWDQDKLMSEFDRNDDDALQPQEYQRFVTEAGLTGSQTGQTARAQSEQERQTGQQRREVELESADVQVDPGQSQVEVTQKSPDVQVQQAETDVSVKPQAPQVTVRQPKPEVTITMPKPEVEVTQQDPNVNVDQGQPDVQIEQQEPEVTVRREKPEVEVEGQQPEVVLQRDKPDVSMTDTQQQADVTTQQAEGETQVQIEESEPQVEITQAEPEVTIETAGQAGVNVQGEERDQARSEQQERGQEVAAENLDEMDAPAAGMSSEERQARQQTLDNLSIDELRGREIVNANGEDLGDVDHVVVSRDQGKAGVVLSIGGILGMGAEKVMAPLDELHLQDDRLVWDTSRTKDELEDSADYQERNYNKVSSENYRNVGELKQNPGQ